MKKKKKTRNSKIHLIFYHMNLDEVLPCDILFKKIIEILLNHIIDKNKFKNMKSLFLLVQCFKITVRILGPEVRYLFIYWACGPI